MSVSAQQEIPAPLGRLGSESRFFPEIGPGTYRRTVEAEDGSAAGRVLALSFRPLSRLQRFAGLGLRPIDVVARLLYLHREALQAELEGRHTRADFLWQECRSAARSAQNTKASWEAVRAQLGDDPGLPAASDLRKRVVDELLVDSLCALYNARATSAAALGADPRVAELTELLRGLLQSTDATAERFRTLLGPAAENEISRAVAKEDWDGAIAAAKALGMACGEMFPALARCIANLHHEQEARRLNRNQDDHARNCRSLNSAIGAVQRLREGCPAEILLFQVLGSLHQHLAIQLGNDGRLADALVAARKAVALYPPLDQDGHLLKQLLEAMTKLQAQTQEVLEQLRRTPNATLNEGGRKLRDQANAGFGPLQAFMEKDEATIVRDRDRARIESLWAELGIAPPRDDDALTAHVIEAINSVFADPVAGPESVAGLWNAAVLRSPDLAELDHERVILYLRKRLAGAARPYGLELERAPNPPSLALMTAEKRPSSEPFQFWLYSRRGLRLKGFAATSTILLVVGTACWLFDWRRQVCRDEAWRLMVEATAKGEAPVVLQGAETFLQAAPLGATDWRRAQVFDLCHESFVRWFARLNGDVNPEVLRHVDTYRRVMESANATRKNG